MARISLSVLIVFAFCSPAFAQHAQARQSAADTSILFDEYRLERAAQDYFNSARFSGSNAGKTMKQINEESFAAINNMENRAAFKSASNSSWQPIGGSQDGHASGRVRGIAFDPTNPKTVYVAAASGGIWKTTDITAVPVQWMDLSFRMPTVNFGSIAVDPQNPNTIYAGTGEAQSDNYREQISNTAVTGDGIFKSTDGGLNWTNVATNGSAAEGLVSSQLIIDPVNTQTIYSATGGNWILRSKDGGATWTKLTPGGSCLSIAIDPVNTNNLYVSGFGTIYRSTNGGDAWIQCKTGLPGGDRITIAVAPSAPNIIYASIGTTAASATLGIWKSDDYGVTWVKEYQYPTGSKTDPNPLGMQEEWCNAITVRPGVPNQIFVGGLDNYFSKDSGKTFQQISYWTNAKTDSKFVHADIHSLVFNGNTLYACTDGGLAKIQSPFTVCNTNINQGIATLQFVGCDANKEFTYVTGGCQDNSTNRAWITSPEFHETIGGDGGHAWVSQEQGNVAYTTYVYANFKQSLDSAQTWGPNLIQTGVGPGAENTPFYTVYDCNSDGSVIALGGNVHVWVSTAGGTDGFSQKSNLSIGNSYAIHVAPADPNGSIMWAASGATLFGSFDQGTTWKKLSSLTNAGTITGITSDPNNAGKVYVCSIGGKHFWVSSDSGKTFSKDTSNLAANLPCWSIARNPRNGNLFIGTEKGVVWSNDDGLTWAPLMNNLPNVLVTQLRVRGVNNDKLLASTYGRGMFWMDITQLGVTNSTAPAALSLDPVYPNPMTNKGATLGFSLKDAGLATITLHDILGREIRILEKSYIDAGKHQISISTNDVTPGTYFLMLTENGSSVSEKIIIE